MKPLFEGILNSFPFLYSQMTVRSKDRWRRVGADEKFIAILL
jgi:hypothetical protein